MIVRDEAHNLPACLESAGGLCDEVVVVDTGSSDGTAEIARLLGATVVPFAWVDDFAAGATRRWTTPGAATPSGSTPTTASTT